MGTTATKPRARKAPAAAASQLPATVSETLPVTDGAVLTPTNMIERALAQGAGVEVMEKLLDMHARWEAMQARKSFDAAMADLRMNMPVIVKDQEVDFTSRRTGDRTNYKFEDLATITEALSKPMANVGLSFRWKTENVSAGVKVTCIIAHRDGHLEETSLIAPLDDSGNKNKIQAIGSAVSYLQRYTLKAAVGLAAARDDDAQAASNRDDGDGQEQRPRRQEPPRQQPRQDAPQQQHQSTAQETFDRLSAAVKKLTTLEAYKAFWARDDVRAAANGLPHQLKPRLAAERDSKLKELDPNATEQQQDQKPAGVMSDEVPFPGDLD